MVGHGIQAGRLESPVDPLKALTASPKLGRAGDRAGACEARRSGNTTELTKEDTEVRRGDRSVAVMVRQVASATERRQEDTEITRRNSEVVVVVGVTGIAVTVDVRVNLIRAFVRAVVCGIAVIERIRDEIAVRIRNITGVRRRGESESNQTDKHDELELHFVGSPFEYRANDKYLAISLSKGQEKVMEI